MSRNSFIRHEGAPNRPPKYMRVLEVLLTDLYMKVSRKYFSSLTMHEQSKAPKAYSPKGRKEKQGC